MLKKLKKAATIKRFEYSLSSKAFEKQTNVIKKHTEVIKNEDKTNKLLKSIIGTDKKYWDKVENALIYLHKKQAEKYVEIDKKMNPEDLVYENHYFNRYGMVISFVSYLLTKITNTDGMYKMLNEFNNKTNDVKSDYLARQDEEIDDVIENALLVITIN